MYHSNGAVHGLANFTDVTWPKALLCAKTTFNYYRNKENIFIIIFTVSMGVHIKTYWFLTIRMVRKATKKKQNKTKKNLKELIEVMKYDKKWNLNISCKMSGEWLSPLNHLSDPHYLLYKNCVCYQCSTQDMVQPVWNVNGEKVWC